jgi:hypothetical protein
MQTLTDMEREKAISDMTKLGQQSGLTESLRRYYWSLQTNLIHGRSPEQIRRMEARMGVAA